MIVCATCLVAGIALSGRGCFEILGKYLPAYIELGFLISILLHRFVLDAGKLVNEKPECQENVLLPVTNTDNYLGLPRDLEDPGVKC